MMQSPRAFACRPIEFDFDRNLAEGTALAVGPDGIKNQIIRVPQELPPQWAVKVTLSVEDYGRLVIYHQANASHL